MGAVVAKKVASATLVLTMDKCQKNRSAPNAIPAYIVGRDIFREPVVPRSLKRIQA
jgi:hypothetical protein